MARSSGPYGGAGPAKCTERADRGVVEVDGLPQLVDRGGVGTQ
jgi:hypothetical protein